MGALAGVIILRTEGLVKLLSGRVTPIIILFCTGGRRGPGEIAPNRFFIFCPTPAPLNMLRCFGPEDVYMNILPTLHDSIILPGDRRETRVQ